MGKNRLYFCINLILIHFLFSCTGAFKSKNLPDSSDMSSRSLPNDSTINSKNTESPSKTSTKVSTKTSSASNSSTTNNSNSGTYSSVSNSEIKSNPNQSNDIVDTLDYFLTKNPHVALKDPVSGSEINQIIKTKESSSYLMKWGPRAFIKYSWDLNYIYFNEEHENDFPNARANHKNYIFTPGYWMKRSMKLGESMDGTLNNSAGTFIHYLDTPHTCNVESSEAYTMKTVLESRNRSYDFGGDLGVQDVIVLRVEQNGLFSEKEWYSREYGLVRWEYCILNGKTCQETVTWNQISPNPIKTLDETASCVGAPQLSSLEEIRKLSSYYFKTISQNNEAVENQIKFMNDGGKMATIGDNFLLILKTWEKVYGAPPPSYNWVDVGMNFLIVNGGTAAEYESLVYDAVKKWYPLQAIRSMSTRIFGRESSSNQAVNIQLNYLTAGGTLENLEAYFNFISKSWIELTGENPKDYSFVDAEMGYLCNGSGTFADLRKLIATAVQSLSLTQIRNLSSKYFGRESSSNQAVNIQLNYLMAGGTLANLEAYFSFISKSWIDITGSKPSNYNDVDEGMTFLCNGGTFENLRNLISTKNL